MKKFQNITKFNKLDENLSEEQKQKQLDDITSQIALNLKRVDFPRIEEFSKPIIAKSKRGESLTRDEESILQLSRQADLMYTTQKFDKDQPYVDEKCYTIYPEDVRRGIFDKITVVNFPGQPNLLDKSIFPGFTTKTDFVMKNGNNVVISYIYLNDLINFFYYTQNVKDIILVDFGCSTISELSDPRTVRRIRRDTVTGRSRPPSPYLGGGKKRKTNKRKNVRRRNKKRKTIRKNIKNNRRSYI